MGTGQSQLAIADDGRIVGTAAGNQWRWGNVSLPMMAESVRIAKINNLVAPGPRRKQIRW